MKTTDSNTKKLVVTAMLTAFCCVATMVVRIPSPTGGYLNMGDAVIILSALLLGPWMGAVVGGVGAAAADLLAAYAVYVPGTLVIKALMGIALGLIHRKKGAVSAVVGAIVAEIIMVGGYYVYTAVFLGVGFAGALPEIPGNCMQGAFGVIAGCLLYFALRKVPGIRTLEA